MALITCKNLCLAYENNTVVSDLSFTVNPGDYLCVVGENGSGKSTLAKALLSLKGVAKGRIVFGDGLKQNQIGYLPQQSDLKQEFPASVWEVVLSGCLNSSGGRLFYTKDQKKRALSKMEQLGILDLKRSFYRELSGGQQRRVLLARALCATRKLILLDEPVSGLDPLAKQELYELIKQVNSNGITVIMISHDIKSAVNYASHILHLQNRPLFFGTTADYVFSEAGKRFLEGEEHV